LSLAQVEKYVPLARERGVSEVARSSRGFVTALRKAGSVSALPEKWQRRRDAFIERHMAQVHAHGEALNEPDGTPTRRHLALIMWAYSPALKKNPKKNPALSSWPSAEDIIEEALAAGVIDLRQHVAFAEEQIADFVDICIEAQRSVDEATQGLALPGKRPRADPDTPNSRTAITATWSLGDTTLFCRDRWIHISQLPEDFEETWTSTRPTQAERPAVYFFGFGKSEGFDDAQLAGQPLQTAFLVEPQQP
jgi:hypothetical protein